MPLSTEVGLGRNDIVLHGDQLPRKKCTAPQFSAHVYCGQTAVCIRIPLGTEVGLSLGDIVLDEDQAPPPMGQSPEFSTHVCCGQTAGWIKMPLGMEEGLSIGHIMLDGNPAPSPQKGDSPQFSAHVVAKRLDGSRFHLVRRYRPRPAGDIIRWEYSSP